MSLSVDIEKKLKDITLKVSLETKEPGEVTGILGASGCGKSMTLKCIAGIVTPDRGRIVLNDRVLFDSEKGINCKVKDRRVGYLFQNYALFPHMTVRENVELALQGSRQEKKERAKQYLRLFHIEDIASSQPARLSGGQQQRVALARILASQPEVLMLDEPFSALDYYLKEKIQVELLDELSSYSCDILMVTHNRDEIYRFCKQIHVLDRGSLVISGETKAVFANPQMTAAAKLTGCKNIVEIKRLSDHEFCVPEWNEVLTVDKIIPEDSAYIGIRAHYLRRSKPVDQHNVIPCRCTRVMEDPFEVTLILEHGIWWKLSKEDWKREFKGMVPETYVIPEESILFLRG